jgi:Cation transporting ATPase, C-terminus
VECFVLWAFIDIPPLRQVFATQPLSLWQWLILLACPPLLLGAEEVRKAIGRRGQRHSKGSVNHT